MRLDEVVLGDCSVVLAAEPVSLDSYSPVDDKDGTVIK